jgi:hypothetical protein
MSKKNVCIAITSRGSADRLLQARIVEPRRLSETACRGSAPCFERRISSVSAKWRRFG